MSLDSLSLSSSLKAFLEEATARYEAALDQPTASYLIGRGLDPEGVTARFARLGLVSDPMPGHERFRGRLALPYVTPSGVVAMKFRCLGSHANCKAEGHEKYLAPSGGKIRMYNTRALLDSSDTVAVCEGELDALMVHQIVGVPAVGTWGTNWFDHYPRMFADFDRVLVIADNDLKDDGSNPGVKHARKIAATINRAEVVEPPEGLDVSEWIVRDGVAVVRKAMGL